MTMWAKGKKVWERLKKGKLGKQEETGMGVIKSSRGVSTGDKKQHIWSWQTGEQIGIAMKGALSSERRVDGEDIS